MIEPTKIYPPEFNLILLIKLYVNGTLVSLGPARGDTYYWNYETVDLAPYLNTITEIADNVITVLLNKLNNSSPGKRSQG